MIFCGPQRLVIFLVAVAQPYPPKNGWQTCRTSLRHGRFTPHISMSVFPTCHDLWWPHGDDPLKGSAACGILWFQDQLQETLHGVEDPELAQEVRKFNVLWLRTQSARGEDWRFSNLDVWDDVEKITTTLKVIFVSSVVFHRFVSNYRKLTSKYHDVIIQ